MYTLWSRGELLGESSLDYVRRYPRIRTGDLQVTAKGLAVMERITQARSDCRSAAKRLSKDRSQTKVDDSELKELLADYSSARDQEEALALELHAPDGSVIPTREIFLTDTEYLLAIEQECEEEEMLSEDGSPIVLIVEQGAEVEAVPAEWEEEDHLPWAQQDPEREPERFQITVTLADQWSIP